MVTHKQKYTDQQVAEWYQWYREHQPASYKDVAQQFGLGGFWVVYAQFSKRGYTPRNPNPYSSEADYAVDPFGAAVGDIRLACQRALEHSGGMSQGEYDRLVELISAARRAIA